MSAREPTIAAENRELIDVKKLWRMQSCSVDGRKRENIENVDFVEKLPFLVQTKFPFEPRISKVKTK